MDSSAATRSACKSLHPALAPFVEQCLANDRLNCQGGVLEVVSPRASSLDFEDSRNCDRFTLRIPYCGAHIEWEVLFDRNHPYLPPDVIFSGEDEKMEFSPDIEKLKSLSCWSLQNPRCLSLLIEELLSEYKRHNCTIAAHHPRLNFELDSVLQSKSYSSASLHCSLSNGDKVYEPVARFYIPLTVDFSMIPAYLTKDNPGPDTAALMVTFYPPSASRVLPLLFLSPRVERALGGTGSLRLPPWGGENGDCLMDYVPHIHKLLADKVLSIVESYVRRKELCAALLSVCGQSVLEYDTESFKRLGFLFEHLGFSFVILFLLTDDYPQEKPQVIFRSIYHRLLSHPCQSIATEYPYSPRWSTDEQTERIRNFIMQMAPQFMEISKERGECL